MERLTSRERRTRLRYVYENLDREWSNVIFSDVKEYTYRRQRSQLYNPSNYWCFNTTIQPTRGNGRTTERFWGWISQDGPGDIVSTPAISSSEKYCGLLENVLIPSVEICYGDMRNVVVMQVSFLYKLTFPTYV